MTCPSITERLLMGRKESNQTKKQTPLSVITPCIKIDKQLVIFEMMCIKLSHLYVVYMAKILIFSCQKCDFKNNLVPYDK